MSLDAARTSACATEHLGRKARVAVEGLLVEDGIVVPGAAEVAILVVQLKAGVFGEVEVKLDAAAAKVGIDAAEELLADQAFQIGEVLDGKNEGGAALLLGLGGREDVMGAAVALGDWDHAVVRIEDAGFTTAELVEPSTAEFDGIVIHRGGARGGLCHSGGL